MTSVILEPTTTRAGIELVDIYSIYYWLHPAQFAAEHREVGIDDKSDA